MKFALPALPSILLGLIAVFLYESKIDSLQAHHQLQISQLVDEDMAIIDDETEQFYRELRDVFLWADKYQVGEKLLLLLDTIDALNESTLNEVAQQVEDPEDSAPSVSDTYSQYTTQVLVHVRNYMTAQASRFMMTEEEVDSFAGHLAERLWWDAAALSDQPQISWKLLEAQIIRSRYWVVHTIGSIFASRDNRYSDVFPAVLNFGKLKPILHKEETIVELGVQSYDFMSAVDSFKLVVQDDTLSFDGTQFLLEYPLPTHQTGDNQLVIKLLSINPLTGEVYESERWFDYYVNETLN